MTADSDPSAPPPPSLADLRAEIDALDDAMLDLLRHRAEVVARMAQSRAKGGSVPLRPGREALILRRLLGRNGGSALAPAALVRLWREIFAQSTAAQGSFAVAAHVRAPEDMRLAREHFGALTPLRGHPTPARALTAVGNGEAAVAVLPLPQDGEAAEARWWPGLDAPRLSIVARLPFWSANAEPRAEALVVAPVPPDATGADRSLLRLEVAPEVSRAALIQALTTAGLPPRSLILHRGDVLSQVLVELDGAIEAGDPRLAALPATRVTPLGFYAVPLRGE